MSPRKPLTIPEPASTLLLATGILLAVVAQADDLTMRVEQNLAALGYDPGTVDGEADVKTAIAISQFQAENGLEITGSVSPQLVGVLLAEVDRTGTAVDSAASAAQSSVSNPSSRPVANPAQPAGLTVTHAPQGAFQAAASNLGRLDATLERCQGTRPGYRAEFDALVSNAHPNYREEGLSVYDSQYETANQLFQSTPEGACPESQIAQVSRHAEQLLTQLRPRENPASVARPTATPAATAIAGQSQAQDIPLEQGAVSAALARANERMQQCEKARSDMAPRLTETSQIVEFQPGTQREVSSNANKASGFFTRCIATCGALAEDLEQWRNGTTGYLTSRSAGQSLAQCDSYYTNGAALKAEVEAAIAAAIADTESEIASVDPGDAASALITLFQSHGRDDYTIDIVGDRVTATVTFSAELSNVSSYSIHDIEIVQHRVRGLLLARCANRVNCVTLTATRPTGREVSQSRAGAFGFYNPADEANRRETRIAVERWLRSVGATVELRF